MEEQETLTSDSGVIAVETAAGCSEAICAEQSTDSGSHLVLGPAFSLASSDTDTALEPASSAAPGDCSTTSSLQNQLIIMEPLASGMVIVTGRSDSREVFVIPSNHLSESHLALISTGPGTDVSSSGSDCSSPDASTPRHHDVSVPVKPQPCSAPCWALRLNCVEKLGDSYRGFCCSESELELVLMLHKQQTGVVFGTRQSPSVDKLSTRLMWRSQYVPYDGIPFINTGSRAVVMECQYGPRRKGQLKKCEARSEVRYRATCPARIYIKKVRKFPEYSVPTDLSVDKKKVRQEQEKAFTCLKNQNLEMGGVIRFYVQLPTEKAHLYHNVDTPIPPPPPNLLPPAGQPEEEEEGEVAMMEEMERQDGAIPSRLHPRLVDHIRQLVAAGHCQVYSVRKQLRHFVEKELFKCDRLPSRHNTRYFPTVNDIQNIIHESQKAMGQWAAAVQWTEDGADPAEAVTVTLTPAAPEAADAGDSMSHEAVQLFRCLSSLQPQIFAQLQGETLGTSGSPSQSSRGPPPPIHDAQQHHGNG